MVEYFTVDEILLIANIALYNILNVIPAKFFSFSNEYFCICQTTNIILVMCTKKLRLPPH